jgi:hypothetical protein
MTKVEFQRAYALAISDEPLDDAEFDSLIGFALPAFQAVAATVRSVARMIRWQCVYFSGGIDGEALAECQRCFRHRVTLVD